MEYRKLPKGNERISILGIGTSSIGAAGEKEAREVMAMALEQGINYFDLAPADAVPFPAFGQEIGGCRKDVYFQIHFRADYHTGTYGWTTNPESIRRSIDWQLNALKTDYIDFGFLHCIDAESDLQKVQENGVLEWIKELKDQRTEETGRRSPYRIFFPHACGGGKDSGYRMHGYDDVQYQSVLRLQSRRLWDRQSR